MPVLRLGLLQEYNVGIGVAADESESLAIEGPVKVPDAFGFEVGDLLSRRTVERLEPEGIRVLVKARINDRFAIMGEANRPKKRYCTSQVHKFRVPRRADGEQRQHPLTTASARE